MEPKTAHKNVHTQEKKNYIVTGDVILAFVVCVEATSEEEAIDIASAMSFRELDANTSEVMIEIDDVYQE